MDKTQREKIQVETNEDKPASVESVSNEPDFTAAKSRKKLFVFVAVFLLIAVIIVAAFFALQKFSFNGDNVVRVVVSAPENASGGKTVINSVILAFEQNDYMAGDTKVELIILNDGDENGLWQEDLERKNAQTAADDQSVIAYIGPTNSGAAKISMPILNLAGILQVSPTNTWPGLTKGGFFPGEPGKFYPTGARHYVRVVTTDDLQGPAGAVWARELGFNSVYIIDDGEVYGRGISELFRDEAEAIGVTVLGHKTINKTVTDFTEDVLKIKSLKPDLVYYGGGAQSIGPDLLSELREAGVESAFMGPDGILGKDFITRAGKENAEGVFVTTVGALALNIGTAKASAYHRAYIDRFGEVPGVFGSFGYESAQVVLSGIAQAENKDRESVLAKVRGMRNFEGLFGRWGFDAQGDTTFRLMSGNVVHDGKFDFVRILPTP